MHPNERVVRDFHDAKRRGDLVAMGRLLTNDVVQHYPGRSRFARGQHGKAELVRFLKELEELSGGNFRLLEVHDVLASDDHVVALDVIRAERDGKSLEYRLVLVYHVRDGKIAEVWVYPEDLYAFDEFWS